VFYWITIRRHIVFLLALTCGGGAIYAQLANTTSLVGTVTDSAGAAMPDVSITAVNTATQDTYKTSTNSDGNYTIAFPRIGAYRIEATHAGFQTLTKSGVTVDQNQTVRTDFALQVGQVSQNIEVKATTPPISTDDASIREVVGQQAVVDLPLNGRNPLQLATLTAGVLPGQKASNGVPPGEDYIGAGTREIQNSVSLDGIAIMNNLITTTPFHPSPDAIQQVDVQTGTYSAQYGAYLGLHLDLVTKTGTNDFHGAVWEFFRNDKLDARNFFLSPTAPQAPLRQNQFGVQIGGPIRIPKLYDGRNRTFFMFDYEGLRLVKNVTSRDTVLTPLMRQGDFSQSPTQLRPVNGQSFPGNKIPASLISPQALRALQYMPLPNLPGISNNLTASYPNNDRYNQNIGRLDQNIGNNIRLFFRYAWNNEQYLTGATTVYNETSIPVQTRNWVGGYTHTLTPNMVNDFRVGRQHLVTDALNYWYVNNLTTASKDLGIPGFDADVRFGDPGIPVFSNTGMMTLGNAATNWFQLDATWQGTDSFTWTHGAHTLIFGAELRKLITSRAAVNNSKGMFTFSGGFTGLTQADLLLGIPINDLTPGPQIRNKVAEWRDGFFIVDNWQASKKLTLNLGLRYELPTVPYTVNGFATILNPAQTALVPANPPVPGFEFIGPNHKNFAPRVGLAYRVTDRTVIRSGYGIYYNPNQTNSFTFLSANPPFGAVVTCTSATNAPPAISLNAPTPVSACGTANIFNIITPNPSLPTQYMNQWSFSIQQGLWAGAALDTQYLGSQSVHLDRSYFNNSPTPGPGVVANRRPNKLFGDIRTIQNDETANYNGLSVVLRQRLSHGISALASYTWSHTLDVSSDSNGGGAPMNPYNWRGDYGNSNWDVRHRFVASFNYALPIFNSSSSGFVRAALGGWQTNGILTLQSGFPFNVILAGDPANTGRSSERPNIIGVAHANCGDNHLTNCIDPSAFQAIPSGTFAYGNAGRNILYGPGLYNVDFSLFKNFRIRESTAVQFRSEFFNLLNTPAFSNPSGLTFGTSTFGSITSTKHDNRQIQFALKFLF
jgi:Carboxypeptidase regulatory-like domain/TonB dependent receptor